MSASTDEVSNAHFSFLPEKSREKYLKAYELFNTWRLSKGAENYSESVLLSYFMEISKIKLPSTLWSIYSMLKAVIKREHDVNIETFEKLLTFLRKKSEGHKPTKSKIFTASEIEKFLNEAPDHDYLCLKVVLIIGIYGACRCKELFNVSINDVEKHSDKSMLVKLTNSKTKIERSLMIREEYYVNFIDKYMSMRPSYAKTTRFFLQYDDGKCKVNPMGINKFSEIPRKIAIFLKLEEPHLYTGHCLRLTSFALLHNGDSGTDLTSLNSHGDKRNTDAEGHIEESTDSNSKIPIIETIYLESLTDMSHPSTLEENFLVAPDPEWPPQYTIIETGSSVSMMQENGNMSEENFIIEIPQQYTVIKTDPFPNNMTSTVPNKSVTFNLTNCSLFTFDF